MSTKPNPKPAKFDERAPYEEIPSSKDGELGFARRRAQTADLNALSFSETSRTPYDGDQSRSQAKFRTTDSTKKS